MSRSLFPSRKASKRFALHLSLATATTALSTGAIAQNSQGPWQLYWLRNGEKIATFADFDACKRAQATLERSHRYACKPDAATSALTPGATPPAQALPIDTGTPVVVQPASVSMPAMHAGLHVDDSELPTGSAGWGFDRVQPTSEVAPLSEIGAFRVSCDFSHMSYDDPIVYPGQPGAAHLHAFFGNTGTNAASTAQSIATSGNSTCRGGTLNRTAYWVPAMIDTTTNKPITPDTGGMYYKQGYTLKPSTAIQPLPAGLRMIAGDPTNSKPGSVATRFKCIGGPNNSNDQYGSSIPNCDAGASVVQEIFFPQCWDGKNLDSPDHKSHMSYVVLAPGGYACPSTHPVPIPEITFNIWYTVQTPGAARSWRLASDVYDSSLPAGYSSHGDWFNGWRKDVSDAWNANCVQARRDCHAHLLGDGRMIY
jgi:hypothetical protein